MTGLRRLLDDPPYQGFGSCGLDRPRLWSGLYRWTVLSIQRRRSRTDRPTLDVFAGVEEVAGIEGTFDSGVEMPEGRGGGYFPPRFFGEADSVLAADDAAHL